MKYAVAAFVLLIPQLALGATDCQVVEFPDHFQAVCSGDAAGPGTGEQATARGARPAEAQAAAAPPTAAPRSPAAATQVAASAPVASTAGEAGWLPSQPGRERRPLAGLEAARLERGRLIREGVLAR